MLLAYNDAGARKAWGFSVVLKAVNDAFLRREALDGDALALPDAMPDDVAQLVRGSVQSITQEEASIYPDLQPYYPGCPDSNLKEEWPKCLLWEMHMMERMERVAGVRGMAQAGALALLAADRFIMGLRLPGGTRRRWMVRGGQQLAAFGSALAVAGMQLRLPGAQQAGAALVKAGQAIQQCGRDHRLHAALPLVAKYAARAARHLREAAVAPAQQEQQVGWLAVQGPAWAVCPLHSAARLSLGAEGGAPARRPAGRRRSASAAPASRRPRAGSGRCAQHPSAAPQGMELDDGGGGGAAAAAGPGAQVGLGLGAGRAGAC